MIGFSALLLLAYSGRISGISGIVSQLLIFRDRRILFPIVYISGLLSGSVIGLYYLQLPTPKIETDWLLLILAGLLVGFGAHLGSGCTSGHGVCGIGRFSVRSIAATCTFLCTGAATVFIVALFT
ncbi:MAG: hypothetical protein OFPII_27710 [Osedax symbiont Rs1]|nr:MAG: hypothetical protein OFPII_27710 [Osedax symbiont Rs1]